MVTSASQYDFDLFTIGAGSGGVSSSRLAAGLGARVGICESSRVGGTCVIRGCVPKKLLVYASQYRDLLADAGSYGWQFPSDPVHDWGTLIANKNTEIDRLNQIYLDMLSNSGVELIKGHGEITGPHSVRIGNVEISARHILIATGGRPALPPIPGIEHAITSDAALELSARPNSIIVLGAGYIACEFAGIFNGLGSATTLALRGDLPLRGFDSDLRVAVRDGMVKKGVTLAAGHALERIEATSTGSYVLHRTAAPPVEAECIMAATGRSPNTAGLGLASIGLQTGSKGEIAVNEFSTTAVPSVHAIGDVTNRVNLTPVAIAEGRALARTLFADKQSQTEHSESGHSQSGGVSVSHANIPSAVFSQPAAASCGLTEDEARSKGKIAIYRTRFRPMRSSFAKGDDEVMIKLVVDAETDCLLGAHMTGTEAPEIMQTLGVAVVNGLTKAELDRTIAIHPTTAEEIVLLREPVND